MPFTDTPTPDVRVDWREDGFNVISNDAFLTNTAGWSVSAGINAAATSLTRATGDGVLGGVVTNTCAELVTTATNGSGANFDFGTTLFTSGRTYRFRIWLKSVSGTTAAKILIGSLGTPADRASSTLTLTTTWTSYQVDWTPSANRTDAEVNVTNNAASIMTARLCLAEVYESLDDINADLDFLTYTRGTSFDQTSESAGQGSVQVNNIAQRYSPDNAASPLFGLLDPRRKLYVRAIFNNLVYGLFYGTIRRIVPKPAERKVELLAEDVLFEMGKFETSVAASTTRSIVAFRGAVLDYAGVPAAARNLASGVENDMPFTGADQRNALAVLTDCNTATGSIHFVKPHPAPSLLYQYTTIDRVSFASGVSVETFDDAAVSGLAITGYEISDEAIVNSQRVTAQLRVVDADPTVLWTSDEVPFGVGAGTSRTVWARFDNPVVLATPDQASTVLAVTPRLLIAGTLDVTATNAPTVNFTPFYGSAKIVITAGGSSSLVSMLSIRGNAANLQYEHSEQTTSGDGKHKGSDISSELLASSAAAKGLADWFVYRYASVKPRPSMEVENRAPSQISREIGDTITLNFGLLTISAVKYLIRSLSTSVVNGSRLWTTTYGLEKAPATDTWFQLDTAARGLDDAGAGAEGKLAY